MQTTSNGYFDITIRNKYDSVTTKRKGRKEKFMSFIMTCILCSSLMIFSSSVSSSSEVASEDIKGKSEVFPTSTPEAKRNRKVISVTSTTSRVDKHEIQINNYSSVKYLNHAKIVSVTNKSSENQNVSTSGSTVSVTGSAISVTGSAVSVSGSAITLNSTFVGTIKKVTVNQSEVNNREVILTPSPEPSQKPETKEVKKEKKKKSKKRMKLNVNTRLTGKMKMRADIIANICLNNWDDYGVLPSVAIGQAFVESTIGKHCRGYNLWGINSGRGYNYSSLREGTFAYLKVINNGYYKKAPFTKSSRLQIRRILNGGYCVPEGDYYSNFTWALNRYNLEEYDRQMFEILKNRDKK